MARCAFCDDSDEGRLIMSTRIINGEVETIDICPGCFWIEKFKAEAEGENGETLRDQAGETSFAERSPSTSGMD